MRPSTGKPDAPPSSISAKTDTARGRHDLNAYPILWALRDTLGMTGPSLAAARRCAVRAPCT